MWLCLMDSELIKFTQEIEAPHHQRDIMAECVRVCGFTHTHANALSSKHKFIITPLSPFCMRRSGVSSKFLWASLSEYACFFVLGIFFLDCSLSRPLLLFLSIGPVPSLLISVSFFLSLHFSVCLQTYSPSLYAPIFTVCV